MPTNIYKEKLILMGKTRRSGMKMKDEVILEWTIIPGNDNKE